MWRIQYRNSLQPLGKCDCLWFDFCLLNRLRGAINSLAFSCCLRLSYKYSTGRWFPLAQYRHAALVQFSMRSPAHLSNFKIDLVNICLHPSLLPGDATSIVCFLQSMIFIFMERNRSQTINRERTWQKSYWSRGRCPPSSGVFCKDNLVKPYLFLFHLSSITNR